MFGFYSGFNIPQGWNFSPVISDLIHGNSTNILFNQLWEKQSLFPMNCCYPSMDTFSCSLFPAVSTGYDYLLNPQIAINQCQQNWQNGGGFFGGSGTAGAGLFGGASTNFWNNGQMQFPWQASDSNNSSGSGRSQADIDLTELKDIYAKLNKASQDNGTKFMQAYEEEYKAAMKLKTSQEKVDALKKIIEKIDVEHIQEAIYEDKEIRTALANLGFDFPKTKAFKTENDDEACKITAKKIKDAIEQKNLSEVEASLCSTMAASSDKILAYVSAWNKNNPGKPLIKEVAKLLPDKVEEQGKITGPISQVCNSLITKADKYDGSYKAVAKKVKALNKTLAVINEAQKDNTVVTEEDLIKVSKAFNDLYAVLRMTEAAEIDKKIQEKYKTIRDIKADAITGNSIILATKKSLERELGAGNVPDPDVEDEDDTPVVSDSDDEEGSEDVDDEDDVDGASGSSEKKKLTAKELADEVYRMIDGPSDELDYPTVNEYISSKYLNKDNIVEFLGAFYAHGSHEGIIEYLDDEHDNGIITMKNKKNIIESLIAKAKKEKMGNDSRVKKLETILKMYKDGKYKDSDDFDNGGEWYDFSHGFWRGIASMFGDTTTHNEMIDKLMKSLWSTLKNK